MRTSDHRFEQLIDQYLYEITSKKKPDSKLYQSTFEFILQLSVQKIIAELDKVRQLILATTENKTYSVLKDCVDKVATSYGESDLVGPGDVQQLKNLCQQIDDFETASYQFIEKQLFKAYVVDMDRLERLPDINYGNFFYYNQMAPKDVDIAEDVHFLNKQINGFIYARVFVDLSNAGLINSLPKDGVSSHLLDREYILNMLGRLVKFYADWICEKQADIGAKSVDRLTIKNGVNATEGFLFSKYDSKKTNVDTVSSAPNTFKLKSSEQAIRRAYNLLKSDKPKFGQSTSEATFLYLFQGKPITSNYQPVAWEHSLRCLVFFFSKLVENGILLEDEWQSCISNHSLIYFRGKAIKAGTLSSTKCEISHLLALSVYDIERDSKLFDYQFFTALQEVLESV